MKAPEFWSHASGREAAPLTRLALTPASWLYQLGAGARARFTRPARSDCAVICVGNITLGGTGKTPVAIEILRRLRAGGLDAHAVSRGYGGRATGPLRVDPEVHDAAQVGDEPMLLARTGPTWVSKSKPAGAQEATKAGAQAIVLDDGHQNPTLTKDFSLVLIDGEAGLGNGAVFPAGPLRERARAALSRADAVVVMGGDPAEAKRTAWAALLPDGLPILHAWLTPTAPPPPGDIFAFAGIGRPQKFFDGLNDAGARLKATATFPDHHRFSEGDLKELWANAQRRGAMLLTTEKDHVRLPRAFQRIVHAWPVRAAFDDEAALDGLLARALERAHGRPLTNDDQSDAA